MASKNLPTNLTGGESGHPGMHNDAHEVVNLFDFDSLAAGSEGQVVKKTAGGLWAAGVDVGAGDAGFSDVGHRYVDYANGNDANDGLSPASAMKTIQAAHDDLPGSGVPRGGTIWLAAGRHIIGNTTISKDGTRLIGAGVWATELLMDQTGHTVDGLVFNNAQHAYAANFRVTDRSDKINQPIGAGRRGIYVTGSQESVFERIWIDAWGNEFAGTHDFDDAPCALYFDGVDAFGDWLTLRNIRNRASWAGLRVTSGCSAWVSNCVFGGTKESVWIKRRTGAGGSGTSWRFFECQWLGGGDGPGEYTVRIETDTENHAGRVRFLNCNLELSGATGSSGGYYTELFNTVWMGGHLGLSNLQSGKYAIWVAAEAGGSIVGPYTAVGLNTATDFRDDAGIPWWQPSDFSGDYTGA